MKTRVVHCKKEPYDIYIGRGSIWGNDWTHLPLDKTKAKYQVATRDEAIAAYERWLRKQPQLVRKLRTLKGKTLGCYCKPQACHGDILARLADEL